MNCEHNYQYQGTVYSFGQQVPGSGASYVIYEDMYFCTKCLDTQYKNNRVQGNTYQPRISGTLPK